MLTRTLAALSLIATPALGDVETLNAEGTVAEVMDRLESAVTEAGATVFARVDHRAGAEDVGMDLRAEELLIFGNPKLGTPIIAADPHAGLALPLRMIAYEEDGQTMIAWEEVEDLLDDLDVDDDMEVIDRIEAALEGFARSAARP